MAENYRLSLTEDGETFLKKIITEKILETKKSQPIFTGGAQEMPEKIYTGPHPQTNWNQLLQTEWKQYIQVGANIVEEKQKKQIEITINTYYLMNGIQKNYKFDHTYSIPYCGPLIRAIEKEKISEIEMGLISSRTKYLKRVKDELQNRQENLQGTEEEIIVSSK